MNKFYSKNERQVLEFYKRELNTDYRILPYDLNKKEDIKEYLDMVLMSFMDFKSYWARANDLVEDLDETLERFDPLTWLSLVDEDVRGDERMLETMDLLSAAQANMAEVFSNIEEKLRHLIEMILHHNDEVQMHVWNKVYIYEEEAMDNLIEDLLEAEDVITLDEAYHLLSNIMNFNYGQIESEDFEKDFNEEDFESDEPILLHLEIEHLYKTDEEESYLQKYGKTRQNGIISRDIFVPRNMTLNALHYAIQKLFGWQNSHLRRFILSEKDYENLMLNQFKKWKALTGVVFTSVGDVIDFYENDYDGGNFNKFLKKMYSGPYKAFDHQLFYETAQHNVNHFLDTYPSLEIRESFSEYRERLQKHPNSEQTPLVKKTAETIDLTIEEIRQAFMDGDIYDNLLESLLITQVLGEKKHRLIGFDDLVEAGIGFTGPLTHELVYNYDYGDNWVVKITRPSHYDTIINDVSFEDIQDVIMDVSADEAPKCILASGLNVMDDVGGIHGYVEFLENLYLSDDQEEVESLKNWSKSMGWSNRKKSPKKIL